MCGNVAEQGEDEVAVFTIEVTGGLIGKNEFGAIDDSTGNGHSLHFATRKLMRVGPYAVGHTDSFKHFANAAMSDFLAPPTGGTKDEVEIVAHGHVVKQEKVLKHHTHTFAQSRQVAAFHLEHIVR